MIIIVAVAAPFSSSPDQHSPILGHLASSHTVASPKFRTVDRSSWYFCDVAGWAFSQDGLGRALAGFWALRRFIWNGGDDEW